MVNYFLFFLLTTCLVQQALSQDTPPKLKRFQVLSDLSYSRTMFNTGIFRMGNGPSPFKLSGQELGLGLELRAYLGQKQRHFLSLQAGYRWRRLRYDADFASVGVHSNRPSHYFPQVFLFDKLAFRLGYNYRFNIPLSNDNLGIVLGLGCAFDPYLRARAAKGYFMWRGEGYADRGEGMGYEADAQGNELSSYSYLIRILPDKAFFWGQYVHLGFEYPIQNRLVHLGFELHRYIKSIEKLSVSYRSSRTGLNGIFEHNQRHSLRLRLALTF